MRAAVGRRIAARVDQLSVCIIVDQRAAVLTGEQPAKGRVPLAEPVGEVAGDGE